MGRTIKLPQMMAPNTRLVCKLFLIILTAGAILASTGAGPTKDDAESRRRTATLSTNSTTDRITNLPGLNFTPRFRQYAGYLTVSTSNGRNIFYWYVESQNNPATDPVVLWTNGGPGCSGLIGLLDEHGPYILDGNLQLTPNPFSWNLVANMLYVEQPAGVGFSYSKTQSDYETGDSQTAIDNYQLILAFFQRFPERKSNDFYIASESYGGHYMPQLALQILRSNTNGLIKFKGMMVGNPFVDPFSNDQAQMSTYFYHGLIPEYLYQSWMAHCSSRDTVDSALCQLRRSAIYKALGGGIDSSGLDFPICTETPGSSSSSSTHKLVLSANSPQALQLKSYIQSGSSSLSDSYYPCSISRETEYLNRKDVQNALHVNAQWFTTKWKKCSNKVQYSGTDFWTSQINLYKKLVVSAMARQHKLHMLVFSGDDDSVCATAGTQSWIWGLGVGGKANQTWVPWLVDEQTAGYVTHFDLGARTGAKFIFATVHGAGHEVPAYRPKQALAMLKHFLSDCGDGCRQG